MTEAEQAVATLLRELGYDATAPRLVDTPDRVVRALREMTSGETEDPAQYLSRVFDPEADEDHDELIAVDGVSFVALCEHHLLPFTGTATVGYVPAVGAPIVGLSKLGRVVDLYARRLTMQERMTRQVTAALDKHLDVLGSACVLRSRHACLGMRGLRKPDAVMVTSSLTGVFREDARLRNEFLALTRAGTE